MGQWRRGEPTFGPGNEWEDAHGGEVVVARAAGKVGGLLLLLPLVLMKKEYHAKQRVKTQGNKVFQRFITRATLEPPSASFCTSKGERTLFRGALFWPIG